MLKKVTLAVIATGVVGAAALPLESTTAVAATATCKELAEMKYPDDWKARRAWMKACNEAVREGKSLRAVRCGYCDNNAPWD